MSSLSEDKRIKVSVENGKQVRSHFEEDSRAFGRASLFCQVPGLGAVRSSIFKKIKNLTVADIKAQAKTYLAPNQVITPDPLSMDAADPSSNNNKIPFFYQ